jgi:hypothetical protein
VADCQTDDTLVDNPTGGQQRVDPFRLNNAPFMFQQTVDTTMQEGDIIMTGSHGHKNNLVPDADYGPGGDNEGDLYLVNSAAAADVLLGYVTSRPTATTGRGGAVQTIDPQGGDNFSDGQTVGSSTYNVYIIGAEYTQIELNDWCIIKKFRETDGDAIRLYCLVQKPLFMGTDSFGG